MARYYKFTGEYPIYSIVDARYGVLHMQWNGQCNVLCMQKKNNHSFKKESIIQRIRRKLKMDKKYIQDRVND